MTTPARHPRPTLRGLPRRATALALAVTLLGVGGTVAAVYGTGVVLGSRLAPTPDGPPAPTSLDPATGPPSSGPGGGAGSGAEDPSSSSLPDRVEGRTAPADRAVPPGADTGGAGDEVTAPEAAEAAEAAERAGPYRAVWPYATWPEVLAHVARQDPAFSTAEDTALRFAREVVGALDPRTGTLRVGPDAATVEVRTPDGTTTVSLTRPDLGEGRPVPWGVVGASGDVAVAPRRPADGTTAEVRGARAVVGLHDRVGWRGVAVAAPAGATDLRVEPGRSGPAALVAMAGDPRDPSAFAVARVDLSPGAPPPRPPADARLAADQLAGTVAAGDLTGAWARLGDQARSAVSDWRGLAARWEALGGRLAPFAGRGLDLTRVATDAGPVDVVATRVATGAGGHALAFVDDGGGRVLAALEDASAVWTTEPGRPPALVVAARARPAAVIVDGIARPVEAEGSGAVRVPLADVAPGPHVAVAVLLDGRVAVAATTVTTPAPDPVEPPPTTTTAPPPPPTPTTGPSRSTTTVPSAPVPPAAPSTSEAG
ncbi:hypothetical protein PO878_07905 [Iamia majanohamensis]|uniref:Uncharacterized protein n=1 Tax=Iamia majanohamensis TaxID=467976 RepID=A0AAE9YIM0_9ACTN|nr:hypothetical protein [Iamia majanohamensis]WCO68651.1 hypothetical protein PO878_07905 [Iamia majanohamensis]